MAFSNTVSRGNSWKDWKITATSLRRHRSLSIPSISCPSIRIIPDVGMSNPARMDRNVVFPEPEGPMTAAISPLEKWQFTSFRTSLSAFLY